MEGFGNEYYQEMIRSDTHDSQWTQFELDLIRCIKDEHPVIYTKVGDMTRHQRAGQIKTAWKEIDKKFGELPLKYIKARWKSILNNYLKVKIYTESTSEINDASANNKFMDGTLSFLEGENDLFFEEHNAKQTKTSQNDFDEDSKVDCKSYVLDIKDSLHEEVDLDDEDANMIDIKVEVDDPDNIKINTETTLPDETMEEATEVSKKIWSEEELMNATRLTKEMIDQLILIKTRHYYLRPAVAK